MTRPSVVAVAPGRVNLMGDYTDIVGGPVLPMAVNLATRVEGHPVGAVVHLTSADEDQPAVVPLEVTDPASTTPPWARYVAGVVAELRPEVGFTGTVTTTLPLGAGLSSSAALELSVALALGFDGSTEALARLGQSAEHRASGVPCGIMDQLVSAGGVAGHALLIDCHTLAVQPVPLPDDLDVRVVHSGQTRQLATSAYRERRQTVEEAEAILGPLRLRRDPSVTDDLPDDDAHPIGRRARHVISEQARVEAMAAALAEDRVDDCGPIMAASHRSLAGDFAVSTPLIDTLVADLTARPGVIGARLTGAGFGGCVVALCRPGALDVGWSVVASAGAHRKP